MKVALNFTASLGQTGARSGEVRRIGFAYLQHRVGRTAVITAYCGRVLYQAPRADLGGGQGVMPARDAWVRCGYLPIGG